MAAPRLSDAQKQDLVDRFRGGAGTQELAAAFGCSPNTVTRVVRAAIEPSQYEELKRQRGRRAGQAAPEAELAAPESTDRVPELAEPASAPPEDTAEPAEAPPPIRAAAELDEAGADPEASEQESPSRLDSPSNSGEHEAASALAIDDADDFDAYEDDEGEEDGEDPEDSDSDADFPEHTFVEVPISLSDALDQPLITPRPWRSDELPASAYMLVDKTVELQALPLAEIPELGRLEPSEQELQALVLYSNPRQAKRHCGRTQRVIKIPDVGLLERRAPYLLRQGIRRVVVEGALYALPEG